MATVLITGANRGIGLEFACQYAEDGDQVIATCRDPESANALHHLQQSHTGVSIETLDVADADSISALAAALSERNEKLDILINNAGVLIPSPFGEWNFSDMRTTLDTNLIGPALVMQELAPSLAEKARVVCISSYIGSFSMTVGTGGTYGVYSTSKAALNMMVTRAASYFRERGMTLVTMSPGWVKTEMGGEGAQLEVDDSVSSMRKVIADLTLEQCGAFFSHSGEVLPW